MQSQVCQAAHLYDFGWNFIRSTVNVKIIQKMLFTPKRSILADK